MGFAIRAGKFRSGANTLATIRKAHLILVCETAAANTLKSAAGYAKKHRCPLLKTVGVQLAEIVHKDGIKIAAVTDAALAKAIADNAAPVFVGCDVAAISRAE